MPNEQGIVKKRGRPSGSLNHKTRAILAQAIKEGVTQPEAMRRLMRRWWKLALRSEATGQMQRAEDFFERTQGYAVAALPYFHRRLGPVKRPVKVLPTVERVPDGMAGQAGCKAGLKDFAVIRTTCCR